MSLQNPATNAGNAAFKVRTVPNTPLSPINADVYQDKEKPQAVRTANITAARGMYYPCDHLYTRTDPV